MKTTTQSGEDWVKALTIINEIGQTLTTSLHTMDITAICRSILCNLRWQDLFVFDTAEISLWDTQTKLLSTIFRLPEDDAVAQALERTYHLDEGYTGWIATHKTSLLIPDTSQRTDIVPKVGIRKFPYGSYIGVPLKVGLKLIGTLELAAIPTNVYSERDVTILEILTNQAAITIDHVRLFQETQRNVSELALLFDASSELSSTLSYDELLQNLSQQMLNAFPAEDCTIFSFDEATGTLKLLYQQDLLDSDAEGTPDKQMFARTVTQTPTWQTVLRTKKPAILRNDEPDLDAEEVELLETFNTGAIIIVPLVNRDKVTGILALFTPDPQDFSEYQVQLAQSLANQANIALDNARLFSLTDQELQNRVDELAGLQRVSRESNSTLDLERILTVVLEEAMHVTRANFGNINIYDAQTGVLMAHQEQGEPAPSENGHNPAETAGIPNVMEQVLHTGKTILVSDVLVEGGGYSGQGRDSRSMVVIPIYYGGEPVGVINLESQRRNFFNKSQLRYLESLANQAAVAIGNAQAYLEQKQEREQASRRVEQLSRLSEISNAFRTNRPLREVLEDIAYAILESVGYKVVLISLTNKEKTALHHEVGAGLPITEFRKLQAKSGGLPLENLLAIMQIGFRIGKSYFIPAEHKAVWQDKLDFSYIGQHAFQNLAKEGIRAERIWQPGDLLFVPLVDTDEEILGILTVEEPDSGERPDDASIQTLEIFANQAATAIENARLFDLERQRRRLADTLRGVAEAISAQLEFDELLNIVLQELARVVQFDRASIQRLEDDKIVIIGGHGWQDSQQVIGLSFSMSGENPNRQVIETQDPLIIHNAPEAFPNAFAPDAKIKSWLGVPLTYGINILGLIALDSREEDYFTQEDADVVLAFANQVAVAMQNASLFENVKNQVRQLQALTDIAQALNRALDLNEVLNLVLDAVFDLTGCADGFIWLVDNLKNTLKIANTKNVPTTMIELFEASAISADSEPFASIITSGEIQVVEGHIEENLYTAKRAAYPMAGDVTYVPLKTEDHVIGILAIEVTIRSSTMLQLVTTLADLAAIAIDNAQLVLRLNEFNEVLEQRVEQRTQELAEAMDDLREQRDRVETLYQITQELSASFDLDRILTQALNLINRAIGITQGAILLLDRNSGHLIYRAALGDRRRLTRGGQVTEFRLGYGLAGAVMQDRTLRIVPNLDEEADWIPRDLPPNRRSAVAVPLISGEDVVGAMLLFHSELNYFTESHAKLVDAAGTQVANAINNAELYGLITDQAKRLGVMLRTQAAETAKNEAILNGITDGVVVLDADRKITLFNPKAAEILEIDNPALMEDKPLSELIGDGISTIGQELRRKFYDQFLMAVDKIRGGERSSYFAMEVEQKAVVVTLAPVDLAAEELPSIVAVIRDVSREAEIDRIRKEFISTVSHELRTPMTSIKGYADLLLSDNTQVGHLNDTQRRFVQVIQANANRLTGLVNDILEISRIETGRIKLTLTTVNLREIIDEVILSFEGQLVQKSVNVILNAPDQLPQVTADHSRLVQVLVNLIGNAWQYTPEGGDVTVSATIVEAEFIQIDVADTGIGIVEQDLKFIFDRFFRSERTEVQVVDGTGLGLSITKSLVELMGGKIWVESEVDVGSTFSFTVPIAPESLSDPDHNQTGI